MIWIILAILVVGYYIVKAINRSSANNALIAQQQYLNSPEYKKQAQASMAYFSYLGSVLDWEIWIAQSKLKLLNPPAQLVSSMNYKTGEPQAPKTLTDKRAIVQELKDELRHNERWLKETHKEYEAGKSEYSGYHPEDLETVKVKYDLATPFPPKDDYFNENNASSWSLYEEKQQKLRQLNAELEHATKSVKRRAPNKVMA
jgi:hypothetical protein